MKRTGLFVICAIFAVVLATSARVSIGTLSGTVLDAKGAPVAGASVTIQTSDGVHPRATFADKSGHFEFTRWRTGQYDLRATSGKMISPWMKRIMIRSNKNTEVTLHLTEMLP